MTIETCKKNSERALCVWIRTCRNFNKIAKQQDYYEGPERQPAEEK